MSDTPVTPISDLRIKPERLAQIRDAHDRRRGFIAEVHMGSSPVGSSLWWVGAIADLLDEIDRLTAALAERDATIAELRGSAHQIVGDALVRWGVLPEETQL